MIFFLFFLFFPPFLSSFLVSRSDPTIHRNATTDDPIAIDRTAGTDHLARTTLPAPTIRRKTATDGRRGDSIHPSIHPSAAVARRSAPRREDRSAELKEGGGGGAEESLSCKSPKRRADEDNTCRRKIASISRQIETDRSIDEIYLRLTRKQDTTNLSRVFCTTNVYESSFSSILRRRNRETMSNLISGRVSPPTCFTYRNVHVRR